MKSKTKENYLEKIPCQSPKLKWSKDKNDLIILKVENRGLANFLAQKLLKKPKVSYIHLDEFGSFVWQCIDGKHNIICIGELVKKQFGEKAEPLYERLSQFIKTLETNGFVTFIK